MRSGERRDSGRTIFSGPARPDRRLRSPVGEAWPGKSTGASRRFGAVYSDKAGHSAAADAADGRACRSSSPRNWPDEDLCAALDREPVLSAVLRRGVLPASADLRSLVADALAPTDGRGAPRGADPGEPVGRHAHRAKPADFSKAGDPRVEPGDRHDRSTQGGRLSDRRQADASGARAAGQAGPEDRRRPAPVPRAVENMR